MLLVVKGVGFQAMTVRMEVLTLRICEAATMASSKKRSSRRRERDCGGGGEAEQWRNGGEQQSWHQ